MNKCTKCGVVGGCGCLFTKTPGGLICGLCSGKATMEKAAEIRHLQKTQNVGTRPVVSASRGSAYVVINPKRGNN